jgi:hypothetical protein
MMVLGFFKKEKVNIGIELDRPSGPYYPGDSWPGLLGQPPSSCALPLTLQSAKRRHRQPCGGTLTCWSAPVAEPPEDNVMDTLRTRAQGAEFSYDRTAAGDVVIRYGKTGRARVSAADYARLLRRFRGQVVAVGTSRNCPPAGSVGEWLQENVTKVAIASYLAPILVHRGDARWLDDHTLRFTE